MNGPASIDVNRFHDALRCDFGDAARDGECAGVDDGGADEAFKIYVCEIGFFVDGDVADLAAFALQDFFGVVEVGAVVEAEVDIFGVDGDVAVALFEAAGEREADGDGVVGVVDEFGGAGFDGEEVGADVEGEGLDGGGVGGKELQEFGDGWTD